MKNFVLHNPTKIIFGKDTISSIGRETNAYGKRVFLVYGQGSVKDNGVLDTVLTSLEETGCEVFQFGGVRPNPLLSHVHEGIRLFRRHNCDVICAVGGGSVIDSAKAISAGVPVEHDVWKFFTSKKSITSAIPLTCVATVAGSGSENNSGMVITRDTSQLKFGYGSRFLYPKVSILDPESTFSVPGHYTAYGAVDIISHLLEFYCTNDLPSTPVQDRIIEGLILCVIESLEKTVEDSRNYEARSQLMWAAALALSGLPAAGLGRVGFPMHLIEHSLSALYDISHGAGLAVIIPAWMQFHSFFKPEKIAQLGKRIFELKHEDTREAASETATRFKMWFKSVNCPVSLKDINITPSQYQLIAENVQPQAKIWRLKEYDTVTVLKILDLCR